MSFPHDKFSVHTLHRVHGHLAKIIIDTRPVGGAESSRFGVIGTFGDRFSCAGQHHGKFQQLMSDRQIDHHGERRLDLANHNAVHHAWAEIHIQQCDFDASARLDRNRRIDKFVNFKSLIRCTRLNGNQAEVDFLS